MRLFCGCSGLRIMLLIVSFQAALAVRTCKTLAFFRSDIASSHNYCFSAAKVVFIFYLSK